MADSNSMSSVTELTRLQDPDVLLLRTIALADLLGRLIVSEKALELWIVHSFDDMESERECVRKVLTCEFVVFLHVVEKCFFIADMVVML